MQNVDAQPDDCILVECMFMVTFTHQLSQADSVYALIFNVQIDHVLLLGRGAKEDRMDNAS